MIDPRKLQSIESGLLSAFKLYQDGNPRSLQLWVQRIYNLDQAGLVELIKNIAPMIEVLEEKAKDWQDTRSWYEGDYGNGYDVAKQSAGESISELIETHRETVETIKQLAKPDPVLLEQ